MGLCKYEFVFTALGRGSGGAARVSQNGNTALRYGNAVYMALVVFEVGSLSKVVTNMYLALSE